MGNVTIERKLLLYAETLKSERAEFIYYKVIPLQQGSKLALLGETCSFSLIVNRRDPKRIYM